MSAVIVHLPVYAIDGLQEMARQRLIRLAGRRYTQEGEIVLRADEHREQGRNRLALEERVVALVRQALVAPRKRKPTRPSRGAVERRLQGKRETAQRKQRRRLNPGDGE